MFQTSFFQTNEVSGATVTFTPSHLTITMPTQNDQNDYFIGERLLMQLTTEALEILAGKREMEEREAYKAFETKRAAEAMEDQRAGVTHK
jgi:hypothetical protein